MMEIVNKVGATCIIDVTPRWHGKTCQDAEYIEFIKRELDKGHSLALHGVEHRCRILQEEEHIVSWKPTEDEFDCKDYHLKYGTDIPTHIQAEWMNEGLALLEELFGKKTISLMPPAHAFNTNTLHAMNEVGLKIISDYGRWDCGPYLKENIIVLPFDFEDYMKNTTEDGSNAQAIFDMFVKYFKASSSKKGYYATFLHCDFSGEGDASQERLNFLEKMLTYIKEHSTFVTPEQIQTIFLEEIKRE
jgi:peptidoglycan/xylan/chitin deacetylase (PgdA/CDA1 family)